MANKYCLCCHLIFTCCHFLDVMLMSVYMMSCILFLLPAIVQKTSYMNICIIPHMSGQALFPLGVTQQNQSRCILMRKQRAPIVYVQTACRKWNHIWSSAAQWCLGHRLVRKTRTPQYSEAQSWPGNTREEWWWIVSFSQFCPLWEVRPSKNGLADAKYSC